jgi:hypothetical protein
VNALLGYDHTPLLGTKELGRSSATMASPYPSGFVCLRVPASEPAMFS